MNFQSASNLKAWISTNVVLVCKPRRFFTFLTFQKITSDSRNREKQTGERNCCSANTSNLKNTTLMGSRQLDFFGRCGIFGRFVEAIFEVVAPSDVEDPRRPCGRHGALCHLGPKDFAHEKMGIPAIPGIRRFSGL